MRGGGWGIGGNRESGKKKDWKERIVRRNVRNKKIHVLKRKDPGKTKSNIHAWKGNNIKKRKRTTNIEKQRNALYKSRKKNAWTK